MKIMSLKLHNGSKIMASKTWFCFVKYYIHKYIGPVLLRNN